MYSTHYMFVYKWHIDTRYLHDKNCFLSLVSEKFSPSIMVSQLSTTELFLLTLILHILYKSLKV